MPAAPTTRSAHEPLPITTGPGIDARRQHRSKAWSVVRWLPIVATLILAVFAVMQAFGKMP